MTIYTLENVTKHTDSDKCVFVISLIRYGKKVFIRPKSQLETNASRINNLELFWEKDEETQLEELDEFLVLISPK